MPERIGWWTFDAETQTLANRVSDQRIRFEGAVDDAGSLLHPPASGPARLRFSYQDIDVRYPVVVIARYETYGGSGFDHGDSDRLSLGWSIDHLASAAEWRRSCAAPTEIPSYGQWRRVDDALFDALSCWPSGEGRRASTPGAAGSTASGHCGCGVSAPDERKGIRRWKAAFARSSSRWGARHCRGSSWMHRKQSPAPLLPGSGRSGPAGIS